MNRTNRKDNDSWPMTWNAMEEGVIYFSTLPGHIPGRGRGLLRHSLLLLLVTLHTLSRDLCLEEKPNAKAQLSNQHSGVAAMLETSVREVHSSSPRPVTGYPN
jgi:hypothetical protein